MLILSVLLFADRFLETFLLASAWNSSGMPYQVEVFRIVAGYIAMSAILYVQRTNLRAWNVGRDFLTVLILTGAIYALSLPIMAAAILWLATLANFILLLRGQYELDSAHPRLRTLWGMAVLFFAPRVLVMILQGSYPRLQSPYAVLTAVYAANPYFVIFEELVFRGLLWRWLSDLRLSVVGVVLLQALLFWIAHFNMAATDPITFWILVPWAGVVLGAVIARSKSIAITSGLHFTYNLLIAMAV